MANKKVSQLTSKPSVLVTDLFPIADPSTGQLYKTTISDLGTAIGSGVSSVNGLVGAVVLDTDDIQELVSPTNKWFTDTRARAALSASSPLAYNSGTGVFSIPAATSSQNGYLTSTDWTTFNNKLSTATAASTYVPYTGATGNVNLGNNDITAGSFTGGTASFATSGAGAAVGINHSSGAGIALNISKSGSGEGIYVNKTSGTGNAVTIIGTLNATTIVKSGGTSSQFLKADGSVDSTAYLPLAGGTLTGALFGASASFSGFVGFGGNTSPLAAIDVTGAGIFSSSVRSSGYYLTGMTSGSGALYYNSGANRVTVANYNASGTVVFEVNGGSTALTLNSNLSATFASSVSASSFSGASALFSNYGSATSTVVGFGDSNNGLFRPALNALAIATNGVQRFTIASDGAATFSSSVTATLMGVGISSLSSWGSPFSVTQYPYGSYVGGTTSGAWVGGNNNYYDGSTYRYVVSDYATLVTQGGGDFYIRTATTGTAGNAITWNERFRVTNAGNVGIGTTAPERQLHVLNSAKIEAGIYFNNTLAGSGAFLWQEANESMRFGTNNTERMRITSGGYTKASNNGTYHNSSGTYHEFYNSVGGTVTMIVKSNGGTNGSNILCLTPSADTSEYFFAGEVSGTRRVYIYTNGNIQNTNNSYGAISDIKLKENITDATSKLSDLLKIKIRNYNLIGDSTKQLGVIAQELEEVFPSMIDTSPDKDENGNDLGTVTKSVKYSVFVPMLIKAVQELSDKITTLENK